MKNNFLINTLVAVLLGIGSLAALAEGAASPVIEEQRHAMNRLHHWIGLWQGEGWGMTGPGQRESFRITETVTAKLDGTVFLIEGRGNRTTDDGDEIVTHDAVGLLSWNAKQNGYNFRTHDLRGQARDATLELDQDGRMRWGFRDEASGALLRFEIHIEDDTWQQTGRISPDNGENWYPMLEMTLHRQAATSANECP